MNEQDPYTIAVAAIYAAVLEDAPLRHQDVATVRRYLVAALGPGDEGLIEDAVADALERFVAAAKGGTVRAATAAAYLQRIARNRLIDLQRRRREVPSVGPAVTAVDGDDAIARLLDSEADAGTVTAGLAAAVAAGDDETVRLVVLWLDEADRLQSRPSSRHLAAKAGVSHTRVLQALRDFAGYLRPPAA